MGGGRRAIGLLVPSLATLAKHVPIDPIPATLTLAKLRIPCGLQAPTASHTLSPLPRVSVKQGSCLLSGHMPCVVHKHIYTPSLTIPTPSHIPLRQLRFTLVQASQHRQPPRSFLINSLSPPPPHFRPALPPATAHHRCSNHMSNTVGCTCGITRDPPPPLSHHPPHYP
jgi:hypothetical protein